MSAAGVAPRARQAICSGLVLRSARYRRAIVPLALNAVFALLVVHSYVDALRVSFFGPLD